jgi:hypothetical protein
MYTLARQTDGAFGINKYVQTLTKSSRSSRRAFQLLIPEDIPSQKFQNEYGSDSQGLRIRKGKAVPLQAWTGPKGSRRFRIPYFMMIGT